MCSSEENTTFLKAKTTISVFEKNEIVPNNTHFVYEYSCFRSTFDGYLKRVSQQNKKCKKVKKSKPSWQPRSFKTNITKFPVFVLLTGEPGKGSLQQVMNFHLFLEFFSFVEEKMIFLKAKIIITFLEKVNIHLGARFSLM